MSLLLFLGGVFSIAGGVFNWDWFMNDHKAYMAVKLFGRNGARIFYILLGLAIVSLEILKMFVDWI